MSNDGAEECESPLILGDLDPSHPQPLRRRAVLTPTLIGEEPVIGRAPGRDTSGLTGEAVTGKGLMMTSGAYR